MAGVWSVRERVLISNNTSGVSLSGAKKIIRSGFVGLGVISIFIVVAALSRSVGCKRQKRPLSQSQRSMLASRSWACLIASAWRRAPACRSRPLSTAKEEDWSRAMSPANLGKIDAISGSCRDGQFMVEAHRGILVHGS